MSASRSLRVLMTADAVGGVWRHALELAHGLAARGTGIVLAVLGPAPDAAQRDEARAIAGLDLVVMDLPLDWTAETPAALAETAAAIARLAAQRHVDLVHLHAPALFGETDWPVRVITTAHSCVATWWRAVRGGDLPDDFVWRAEATRRGLERADAVTAPSAAFASMLRDTYALRRTVIPIHNGRRPLPRAHRSREGSVLTAGRLWDEGKNIGALDRAAAYLHVPVCAAGALHGPNGARVQFANIQALGALSERDLAAEYAAASVFVSPARYEPFGLAVLEAAQCGLALVLSDIPTFRELWDGAALFVDPGDARALAEAIRCALDHADGLGAQAREQARRYSVSRMAEAVSALQHRLVRMPLAAGAG